MEFKYMLVGTSFYGNQAAFEQNPNEESQGEEMRFAFMRKKTMDKDYIDLNKSQAKPTWDCPNYRKKME